MKDLDNFEIGIGETFYNPNSKPTGTSTITSINRQAGTLAKSVSSEQTIEDQLDRIERLLEGILSYLELD